MNYSDRFEEKNNLFEQQTIEHLKVTRLYMRERQYA